MRHRTRIALAAAAMGLAAAAALVPSAGAATAPKRWACTVKSFQFLFSPDAELAGVLDRRSAGLIGTRAGEGIDERCKTTPVRATDRRGPKSSTASGVLTCTSPVPIHVTVAPIRKGGRVVGTHLVVTTPTSKAPIAAAEVYKLRKGTSIATWSGKRCKIVSGLGPPLDEDADAA